MKIKFPAIFITILLVLAASSFEPLLIQSQECQKTGCLLNIPQQPFDSSDETAKRFEELQKGKEYKSYQQSEEERKKFLQAMGIKAEEPKAHGRLLDSTNNQFYGIDIGNAYQVTDGDYIYSLRAPNLTIHKINGTNLTQVYKTTYAEPNLFPLQIHVRNNYFAIIFVSVEPPVTLVKIFKLNGPNSVSQVSTWRKDSIYVQSRQYDSKLLVICQTEMQKANNTYKWLVNNVGVNDVVYQGISSNTSTNGVGDAARSAAKIPLGPIVNKNYRFATYLNCDFTHYLIMSSNLNVFIAGSNFNTSDYGVVFQTFSFLEPPAGQTWGKSKWAYYKGIVYSSFPMTQYNGYFRFVVNFVRSRTNGSVPYSKEDVAVGKIPISSFNPNQGTLYSNQGVDGAFFVQARWKGDLAFLIFQNRLIKSFSTSFGFVTGTLTPQQTISGLYPYGDQYMVGFGYITQYQQASIVVFKVKSYKLFYHQSINVQGSQPGIQVCGAWYCQQYLQLDWLNKRITFGVYFSGEEQPYKAGYYQVYANPEQNCISSLPVPSPCPNTQNVVAPVLGKLFKHWNDRPSYNWNTDQSEQVIRSSTLTQAGVPILLTGSQCQLQARVIVPPTFPVVIQPTNQTKSTVVAYDLCK